MYIFRYALSVAFLARIFVPRVLQIWRNKNLCTASFGLPENNNKMPPNFEKANWDCELFLNTTQGLTETRYSQFKYKIRNNCDKYLCTPCGRPSGATQVQIATETPSSRERSGACALRENGKAQKQSSACGFMCKLFNKMSFNLQFWKNSGNSTFTTTCYWTFWMVNRRLCADFPLQCRFECSPTSPCAGTPISMFESKPLKTLLAIHWPTCGRE